MLTRRQAFMLLGAAAGNHWCTSMTWAHATVAPQPYFAAIQRTLKILEKLGSPISALDAKQVTELALVNDQAAVDIAEQILDRYTIARIELSPDGVGRSTFGGATPTLIEQGWKLFLVRVSNPTGITQSLDVASDPRRPGTLQISQGEPRAFIDGTLNNGPLIEKLWLLASMNDSAPLSGIPIEYRAIQLFSRDQGNRSAALAFAAGTYSVEAFGEVYRTPLAVAAFSKGFTTRFDFKSVASREVALSILDSDDVGCTASLLIKDRYGHIYPPQVMRLAPDFRFQPQIYRADGETVCLPDGEYEITVRRGPEYLVHRQSVNISADNNHIRVHLQRWIDPAHWGWYSGDTHIHAAGCAHYVQPTEGVTPETMIRHVRGEGLSIGAVLTWAPSWYYQKQFFSGHAVSPEAELEHPELQAANNVNLKPKRTPKDDQSLLRYDLEVSGFPSSLGGHLVLLRLKELDYPGTQIIEDWPSWNLPILQWAKRQGSIVGFAHCGSGMRTDSNALPNYDLPRFDSIGLNEAIVDITHDACDFLSGCEFEPASELNGWYHLLNCGFRLPMLGETDYPCITGERAGVGRTYIRLERRPVGNSGYDAWVQGITEGRLYCGDGRSHFLEFSINDHAGERSVDLSGPAWVRIDATVAARIEENQLTAQEQAKLTTWHIEHARIVGTRKVPLELIINGQPVETIAILADGVPRSFHFKTHIERSSWVSLRILPSSHTRPLFVQVASRPIRASRRSAQWLRTCVDVLWEEKYRLMRENERPAAAWAYNRARTIYEGIAKECDAD